MREKVYALKLIFFQIFLLCPGIAFCIDSQKNQRLCHGIYAHSLQGIKLSKAEKKLICNEYAEAPYNRIPSNQKKYLLAKFLEARGYYNYKIEDRNTDIFVDPGPIALTRSVAVKNDPIGIDPSRFWKVYGHPMTSSSLDLLEQWIRDQLAKKGFPCIQVKTTAYPESGDVEIDIKRAHRKIFGRVDMEPIPGLMGGVESRFQAFQSGDVFDSTLLAISHKRLLASELVLNASYSINCSSSEDLEISFSRLPGKPRLISISTGFDTEEIFNFEASWQNARLGGLGSMMLFSAKSSYRMQSLRFLYDWYYAPFPVKHSIKTFLSLMREFEKDYENIQFQTQLGPTFSFDSAAALFEFWLGIRYEYNEILRGEGLSQSYSLPLVFNLNIKNHEYELQEEDPSSGYRLHFSMESSSKDLGSDFSEFRIKMDSLYLKNLFQLDPAVWVFGLRLSLATINLGSDSEFADYPQSKRLYLGGSNTIRGFSRKSIPKAGALTNLYLGSELRLLQLFPFGLQPVVFLDYARQGQKTAYLQPTNYWAPGIGVHWKTFIGLVRASVSYGLISGRRKDEYSNLESLQVYISYGENF